MKVSAAIGNRLTRDNLDRLYDRYNRREYVHPDPLEFLYAFPDVRDRELVGLIASGLAYGRVEQILKSVRKVLLRLSDRPAEFIKDQSAKQLERLFQGFKHRFTTGREMATLLSGAKCVLEEFGSLETCFLDGMKQADETVYEAGLRFSDRLRRAGGSEATSLLPQPEGKSACKRLHLYLRWMVRRDAVDPGGWTAVSAEKLIVPLDTHMHRIALEAGLTKRKQADGRTARDVTAAFRKLTPEDAVRYDFTLTRIGMRRSRRVDN